jgi:GT2 family glycosyltransferase/glycosyltransferase involved in cell wall biosynthesis
VNSRASIVIPVFNNLALTKDCLNSIFECTDPASCEIIVVDNGSSDGTWDYLQTQQPRIRSMRNPRNMFFARGCNRGGWAAREENIVFLNNDTLVSPGWLESLVLPLEQDPTIGITGNKQLFPDGRVWHAGTVIGADRLPWHVCYGFHRTHPALNHQRDCQTVSGCCLAIRRDLFKQLRGFDPHFENGFEDADLCLRARALGYRVVYAPASEIVHLVSRTEGRFDREDENREKFKTRWSAKLVPDEREFLLAAGFLRPDNSSVAPRVGLITPITEQRRLSRHAEQVMTANHGATFLLLTEFGTDVIESNVIPCWDRSGQWFYPLLRWCTTLDLDLIHVDFDSSAFPATLVDLLHALKRAGKPLMVSIRREEKLTTLITAIAQIADLVTVESEKLRRDLARAGFPPSKVEVALAQMPNAYLDLYRDMPQRAAYTVRRVRWEGPQLVNHSLALVNRQLELALLQMPKLELSIAPTCDDTFAHSLNSRTRTLAVHYQCPLSGPADVHVRHQWPPNWDPPKEGRWVVIQPWEYGGLPEEWVQPIQRDADEVWAPSTFVRDLYIESGVDPGRVHVVPNGVDADIFRPGDSRIRIDGARGFKFLFVGGTIHRKGIDILLDAYSRAFSPTDDVTLVIKDMGTGGVYRGQGLGDHIRASQRNPAVPHIVYLERDLTEEQMVALYNSCQCLVHPYRGEGFALPVLEAMSCAVPVIVTAGGATDDFVDDETGYRVPARKTVFGERCISGLKTVGDLWMLEPDADALKETLLRVFNDRVTAREMGQRARAKVEAGWTWKHAAEKANQRIEALRTTPVLRHLKPADAAVLIDGVDADTLESLLESLKAHTYASLSVFVRGRRSADRYTVPGVELLECDFPAALEHVRTHARTRYLVLITEPVRFSKHWLSQLVGVANSATQTASSVRPDAHVVPPRAVAVMPSSNLPDCHELDEKEFQRQARIRWREKRGGFHRVEKNSEGCVLVTWNCLSLDATRDARDTTDWLSRLQHLGVQTFVAEDTCFGLLNFERVVTHRE